MSYKPTNRSSTIDTGGQAQILAPENSARNGWWVRNPPSAPSSLWVCDLGTDATQDHNSLEIEPGQIYVSEPHGCSSQALSIISAYSGHAFTAREW